MDASVIILAAGKGTRMRSNLPKVLHTLAGRPLLAHVIDTAHEIDARQIHVVYGHGGEQVPRAFDDRSLSWVEQAEQLGTGHAVRQAMPGIPDGHVVLVLYGDVPLIRPETLMQLLDAAAGGALALLTARFPDPSGYGRIIRDAEGRVRRIVEHKDADAEQLAVDEINTGFLAVQAGRLRHWVDALENDNAQGEFYLTDVIAMAVAEGVEIRTTQPQELEEVAGVNDRNQLAVLERHYQMSQARRLMTEGVTLRDPARFDLRAELVCGRDVEIDINVILEGRVELGDGVRIGPNCLLRDAVIGDGVEIKANTVIEDAMVGARAIIGPFARLRPGTVLAERVHVGNFVEIKKSQVAAGSKINHLSYIGDASVGERVNIGAGTITCNYDGAHKHRTVIGDDAFIGSDTQLVAPVKVGAGATLGAGTTLTRDAPAGELTLSRVRQSTLKGWKRPQKDK
jgi:bifunctional UDP-N-acetylglucosamine pyrophosphorylase/glucosamine-1-phosphate N-acetyltransferase